MPNILKNEALNSHGRYDVNCRDGAGRTPLHNARTTLSHSNHLSMQTNWPHGHALTTSLCRPLGHVLTTSLCRPLGNLVMF